MSVRLRPRLPADRLHLVTLAAALAATDAVHTLAGVRARVKWPNDVVVDDRKLAGILAEGDGAGAVVVGMGLNVRAGCLPPELADLATAVDLHAASPVDRRALLAEWLLALDAQLDHIDDVVATAATRSATLGRRVRVELASAQVFGVAERLTPEGFLLLRADDGREQVVTAGDVVHLRPTTEPA